MDAHKFEITNKKRKIHFVKTKLVRWYLLDPKVDITHFVDVTSERETICRRTSQVLEDKENQKKRTEDR